MMKGMTIATICPHDGDDEAQVILVVNEASFAIVCVVGKGDDRHVSFGCGAAAVEKMSVFAGDKSDFTFLDSTDYIHVCIVQPQLSAPRRKRIALLRTWQLI